MKKLMNVVVLGNYCLMAILLTLCFQLSLHAQDKSVSVYQYRHVPDDKIDEFIKRETTYWSKVAEKAVKDKTLSFWALLEKVGGYDLPNSSNYLFINTFPDIDKADGVWSNAEATTGAKMADIETGSMSTVTSEVFLHDIAFEQATKAVPMNDFKYVEMLYHDTDYSDSLVNLEKKYWGPFIKKTMDAGQTPQMGWGNAIVLQPHSDKMKWTTVSYDLYKNLQDALMPTWDPKVVFPSGLDAIRKIETERRGTIIYRVIKVVTN